jgi:HK97 family phage portal protein
MNISGVIVHPGKLDAGGKAYQNLKESIEARSVGMANAHKPLLLEEGMKWEMAPIPLADAQFIELVRSNRQDLCGLYRVPPHMIADLERSTNNNIEWQSLEYVKYTMLPWITRWESVLNWKLFSPQEREQGFYVKFNLEGLLRGDYKSRQEGLHIQRQDGIINADEWRELEEYNPVGGVVGETYLTNGNMISVETAAKQPPRQAGASPSQSGGDQQ